MKKFAVRLKKAWLEKHGKEAVEVITYIRKSFNYSKTVRVYKATDTSLDLVFDERWADYIGLKRYIMQLLKSKYADTDVKDIAYFGCIEATKEEQENISRLELVEDMKKEYLEMFGNDDTKNDNLKESNNRFLQAKSNLESLKEHAEILKEMYESSDLDEEEAKKIQEELKAAQTEIDIMQEHIDLLDEMFKDYDFDDDDEDEDDDDDDEFDIDALKEKLKELHKNREEMKQKEEERVSGALKEVVDEVAALTGASQRQFKEVAEELLTVADEVKRTETFDVFSNQSYLFSIGDGCGLDTYLDLIGKIIWAKNIALLAKNPVERVVIGEYGNSEQVEKAFVSVHHALLRGEKGKVQVLCIDISEWMNYMDHKKFRHMMQLAIENKDKFIIVFRVPFVEKDVLAKIRYSLADMFSIRTVSFPPFSREEIRSKAEELFGKYGFTMSETAWEYFFERISEEKSDGKFYGIHTVERIVKELVYHKHYLNGKSGSENNLITDDNAQALCSNADEFNMTSAEMLAKLVGVDGIKERVEEIIAQIQLTMKERTLKRPCIHMRFVGNPGTGKTTVARIIGKMLSEKGVLRVGGFFECAGRDLCGRYIGETSPKTSSKCREAYGSVLFIDEAYSLYRGGSDTKDYGREALETLIAEMENHRNDLVVIMAGYPDEMDTLMKGNPGLASRMPYTIEFPNFTREQLADIFISMLEGTFRYEEGLLERVRKFFGSLPEEVIASKDFANARYVRNLFERTWAKASMRCQLDGNSEITLTCDDFNRASNEKDLANLPKRRRMGFLA